MARSANQKKKLMLLAEFLEKETDLDHGVGMQRILDYLSANDISAERKSIYDDMEALKQLGYDVEHRRAEPEGYYLASRKFELAELKLLVEAVQASRFLSESKSNELIGKLESLCSKYEAGQLQRQVYVYDRVKSMNESIYYNVDLLHSAISTNSSICFKYYEWNAKKELVPRKNGATYHVIPKKLVWFDENYYLIAIDLESEKQKHYRVDKMKSIQIDENVQKRPRKEEELNTASFTKKTFGMFDGEEARVRILAEPHLAGVLLDRFGTDMILNKRKDGMLEAGVDVFVSNPFFGWIFGIKGLKIIGPENVKKSYMDYLKSRLEEYSDEDSTNGV